MEKKRPKVKLPHHVLRVQPLVYDAAFIEFGSKAIIIPMIIAKL